MTQPYIADSLALITETSLKFLIDNNGSPVAYGRYLGEVQTSELKILSEHNIPLIAISRRSGRVSTGLAEGISDGIVDNDRWHALAEQCNTANVNLINYLFVDVEMTPTLKVEYWNGWAGKIIDAQPAAYMPNRNFWGQQWTALEAGHLLVPCAGTWVAMYDQPVNGHATFKEHDWAHRPKASAIIPELAWQHTGNAAGGPILVDYSMPNPILDWILPGSCVL